MRTVHVFLGIFCSRAHSKFLDAHHVVVVAVAVVVFLLFSTGSLVVPVN